jgi:hypothetical protein
MTLNIEDKTYTIPERLTVDQWNQCIQWDFELDHHWPRLLGIITGAPIDQLMKAPKEGLELGIRLISEIANQRESAKMLDVSTLMFGQFVDLEIALGHGVNNKLQNMIDILNPDIQFVDEALYVVEKYIDWRNSLYRQYSNLFGLNDEYEGDEDEETTPDPNHIARSWYRVMVTLSGDNILNLDRVTEEGVVKTLNFMAHQKQIQLQENAAALNQKRKHDLQTNRR